MRIKLNVSIPNTNPTCVICGKPCENKYGNNPAPLSATGRCCNKCNMEVLASRIINLAKKLS